MLYTPCTLVPEALYQEEDKDLWLNFSSQKVSLNQEIEEKTIENFGCVCIYEGRGEHIISTILKSIDPQTCPDAVWLSYFPNIADQPARLAMVVIKAGKLFLGNVFSTPKHDDVVYYVLNAYEHFNLTQKKTTTYTIINMPDEIKELLNQYVKTHDFSLCE